MEKSKSTIFMPNVIGIYPSPEEARVAIAKEKTMKKIYIPKDLDDSMIEMDKLVDEKERNLIVQLSESEYIGRVHFSFGMWLRNTWGLWKGSRLAKYFEELGIFHADDMSGLILSSYYCKLTGQDMELDRQIRDYQDYWKKKDSPKPGG